MYHRISQAKIMEDIRNQMEVLFQEAFPSSPFYCCSNSYSHGEIGNGESWAVALRLCGSFRIWNLSNSVPSSKRRRLAQNSIHSVSWTSEASQEWLCFSDHEYPASAVILLYRAWGETSYSSGRKRLIYTCLQKSGVTSSLQKCEQQQRCPLFKPRAGWGGGETKYSRDLEGKGTLL